MDEFIFTTNQGETKIRYSNEIILPEVDTANAIFICDVNTEQIVKAAKKFSAQVPLVVIGDGEENKNFSSVQKILSSALEAELDRKACFVGIGGGLVCDLAGFAASIYMRGVSCKLVPTTVLAMVDASVGGKTGINFNNYKNPVGSFYKADEVNICLSALETLSQEQFVSGLAEAFKTALLYSQKLFSVFSGNREKILNRDKDLILEIIKRSVIAKAGVVRRDFDEKNERAFLNFGHTFAHALESVSGFSVLHGEAVAWGMGRALELGKNLGLTDSQYAEEVCTLIKNYGWLSNPNPLSLDQKEFADKIILAMRKDKKNTAKKIRFVLQENMETNFLKEVEEADIRSVLK